MAGSLESYVMTEVVGEEAAAEAKENPLVWIVGRAMVDMMGFARCATALLYKQRRICTPLKTRVESQRAPKSLTGFETDEING